MAYSNFGKIIRKEMIDHDENLVDIAKLFDVSASFVSAVLTGGKSTPENWVDELSNHYNYDDAKRKKLFYAYCEDKKQIKINVENIPLEQKKLALQFQRKLPELDEKDIEELASILSRD